MSMSRSLNDGPQEAAINLVKNIKRDRDKSTSPTDTLIVGASGHESTSSTSTTTTTGVKIKVEKQTTSDDEQDEIKVYKDEGAAEEEQHSSENLNEDKIGLVNETEEVTYFTLFLTIITNIYLIIKRILNHQY